MKLVRDDRGSATIELVLATIPLILMLLFVVFCGRMADTRQRIDDAAHQAARAASLARSPSGAVADAQAEAARALADAGIGCQPLAVKTDTRGWGPGSTVTVTITCTVGLSDLALLGVPGSTTLQSSFASPLDVHRSLTGVESGGQP